MEQDDPSYYLAPISEADMHQYLNSGTSSSFPENMPFWNRPATPFRYQDDDPEHIDAIFGHSAQYIPVAPRE